MHQGRQAARRGPFVQTNQEQFSPDRLLRGVAQGTWHCRRQWGEPGAECDHPGAALLDAERSRGAHHIYSLGEAGGNWPRRWSTRSTAMGPARRNSPWTYHRRPGPTNCQPEGAAKRSSSSRSTPMARHRSDLWSLMKRRRRLRLDGLPHGPDDWMFCNRRGRFLNPESLSQLFDRVVPHADVPRIRFHDLRHTHASLLVASGVPIKVVTERRPLPSRVHDAHLPTPPPRHERRRRRSVRHPRRHREPVDVYRLKVRRSARSAAIGSTKPVHTAGDDPP